MITTIPPRKHVEHAEEAGGPLPRRAVLAELVEEAEREVRGGENPRPERTNRQPTPEGERAPAPFAWD